MLTSKLYKHLVSHARRVTTRLEQSFGIAGKQNTSNREFLQLVLTGERKLLRESVQNDSKQLLNELLKAKSVYLAGRGSKDAGEGLNLENINKILMKLHGAGYFEHTDLANLQMFLEWADLAWLPNKVQTQLYRSLILFLNESKYSLLIKYGVCMQTLRLVDRQPSSLRVSGLYEYPVEFMFDKCATLSLYEMVILYTKGQVLKLHPQEEAGFLEERILEEFERLRSTKLDPFDSCPFGLWLEMASYVAAQRYRGLETSSEEPRFCEFNRSQTRLLQLLVTWLSTSRDWSARIDLRKLKEIIKCCQAGGVDLGISITRLPNSVTSSRPAISPMQVDMLAVLRVIYSEAKVIAEHPVIKDLDLCVDAYIEHLNIGVETDGSYHRPKFLDHQSGPDALLTIGQNPEEPMWQTTRTLFRTGLVTDAGYKLLRVSDLEWNRLKGLSAKKQFLVSKLQTVLAAPFPRPSSSGST